MYWKHVLETHTGNKWGCPLSPLMMLVTLMPLGLLPTRTPLISCSTCSSKLLFFQKGVAVVVIVNFRHIRNEGRGICMRQIECFSKHSLPSFASKLCAKRGRGWGGIFLGAYRLFKWYEYRHKPACKDWRWDHCNKHIQTTVPSDPLSPWQQQPQCHHHSPGHWHLTQCLHQPQDHREYQHTKKETQWFMQHPSSTSCVLLYNI